MMEMSDIDYFAQLSLDDAPPTDTPPQTPPLPRRPLTPGLSSGGIIEISTSSTFRDRQAELSPHVGERCLSASPTISVMTPSPTSVPPPSCSHAYIPPGTYVAFALATSVIAQNFSQESLTHQLLRDYDRRTYLGLVSDSFTYVSSTGEEINEIVVHFVSRNDPPPIRLGHQCLSIYPCVEMDESRGPPLRPSNLFPHVDCKQWTTLGVKLTVETLHESSLTFTLDDDELTRFEDLAVLDYEERRSLDPIQSDDDADALENLHVSSHAFSVEVWTDVRVATRFFHPAKIFKEVRDLDNIIFNYQADMEAILRNILEENPLTTGDDYEAVEGHVGEIDEEVSEDEKEEEDDVTLILQSVV